uniref:Ubiquitin-like domain-containing protein n=1 Tax=Panagrellus redivivus TaxID=6233 RepID=A0A7E4VDS9_PANRE
MSKSTPNDASNDANTPEFLSLIVVDDKRANRTHFRVKFDDPFAKFFDYYAYKQREKRFHFLYNNRVVFGDNTPRKLMMKDNDYITVGFDYLTIPIVWSNKMTGDENITVEYDTPFVKFMNLYCEEPLSHYVFKYHSREVLESDTPRSLRMQPHDCINVLDCERYNRPIPSDLHFWIHDMNGRKLQFEMAKYNTVADIMQAYTSRTGILTSQCRFLHDYRDLNPEEEVKNLRMKMKDDDVIGVIYKTFVGPGLPSQKDVTVSIVDESGDKRQLTLQNSATIHEALKMYSKQRDVCITDYFLKFDDDFPGYSDTLESLGIKDGDLVTAIREPRLCQPCLTDKIRRCEKLAETARQAAKEKPVEKPRHPLAECRGTRCIKSYHGTYLRALKDQPKVDMVPAPAREWENWIIEFWDGKAVFKAIHSPSRFIRAKPDRSVDLVFTHPQAWEMWSPFKNDDGSWSFQSHHGLWLSCDTNGHVYTNNEKKGWESFWLEYWN